jgi:hypothetical protein
MGMGTLFTTEGDAEPGCVRRGDFSGKSQLHDLREAKILEIRRDKQWSVVKFEFFSRPFLFAGDLTTSFRVGQLVDLEYHWDGIDENLIYIETIQSSGFKDKEL